jgi:hypothetical protein
MVAGNIVDFYFDVMIDLFEVFQDPVVGTDHLPQQGNGFFQLFVRIILMFSPDANPHFLETDIDEDVICQVVVFPPPFICLAGKDGLPLHHLQVVDDCFGGDGQRVRYLGNKTGFLPQQFDDPPAVPVPEDIEQAGNLNSVTHIYIMVVLPVFTHCSRWSPAEHIPQVSSMTLFA